MPKALILFLACCCMTFLLPRSVAQVKPPLVGTFYSMQRPNLAPLPFCPFPDLPIYEIEKGQYLYDDREVDYEALRAQAYDMETAEPNAGQTLMGFGGSGPGLTITRNSQGEIEVQIVNAPMGTVYDLYQTIQLEGNSFTAAHWQKVGSGSDGDIFLFTSQASSSVFYVLGDRDTDQDLDGLGDAYEELVTKTSTISADCPREVYEAVIDGQAPNAWFTLNNEFGTGLTDPRGGHALVNPNASSSWNSDLFAN